MPSPPKVYYRTEAEYRAHFEKVYCQRAIRTFDNIAVFFRKTDFDHCMFESSSRNGAKDRFSKERSERIDWIRETLVCPHAALYQGWDKAKKCCDPDRRVAVAYEEFAVVIRILRKEAKLLSAQFITAFFANNSIQKIRGMPKWV